MYNYLIGLSLDQAKILLDAKGLKYEIVRTSINEKADTELVVKFDGEKLYVFGFLRDIKGGSQ